MNGFESHKDLLLKACRTGTLTDVKRIVEEKNDFPRESKSQALRAACQRFDHEPASKIVELLLDLGANPEECCSAKGENALHVAAQHSSAKVMKLLLGWVATRGSDVSKVLHVMTSDNMNCLSLAARRSNHAVALEVCDVLIRNGAIPCASGFSGSLPLARACRSNNLELVKLLLGVSSPAEVDVDGFTAVHWAAKYAGTAILEVLLEQSPELLNAQSKEGYTPLARCCFRTDPEAVVVAAYLLDRGAMLESVSEGALTPLALACEYSNEGLVLLLLERGADVHVRDEHASNLLHLASMNGVFGAQIIPHLVCAGVNPNEENRDGLTVFSFGCFSQDKRKEIRVF